LQRFGATRCLRGTTGPEARTSPKQVTVTTRSQDPEGDRDMPAAAVLRQKSLAEQAIPSACCATAAGLEG